MDYGVDIEKRLEQVFGKMYYHAMKGVHPLEKAKEQASKIALKLECSENDFWGEDNLSENIEKRLSDSFRWNDGWLLPRNRRNILDLLSMAGFPQEEKLARLVIMGRFEFDMRVALAFIPLGYERIHANMGLKIGDLALSLAERVESLPPLRKGAKASILIQAVYSGEERLVKELVSKSSKAELDFKSSSGVSPVWRASSRGKEKILRILLSAGASPDLEGKDGQTPLESACSKGRFSCVETLVEFGATVSPKAIEFIGRCEGVKENKSEFANKGYVRAILSILGVSVKEKEKFSKEKFPVSNTFGAIRSFVEKERLSSVTNASIAFGKHASAI